MPRSTRRKTAPAADQPELPGIGAVTELYREPNPSNPRELRDLEGLTFVITGGLPGLKREQAVCLLAARGGHESQTAKAGAIVVWNGTRNTRKLREALKRNLVIIGADGFANALLHPAHHAMPRQTDATLRQKAQDTVSRAARDAGTDRTLF